ncbi:MAG TPA: hypothetical protein VFG47_10380 [Geminicoccaceae bacterium]|nr:hypothetical protein [Geminicoccaceae bacterium]
MRVTTRGPLLSAIAAGRLSIAASGLPAFAWRRPHLSDTLRSTGSGCARGLIGRHGDLAGPVEGWEIAED